jgi:hypothetical protein
MHVLADAVGLRPTVDFSAENTRDGHALATALICRRSRVTVGNGGCGGTTVRVVPMSVHPILPMN